MGSKSMGSDQMRDGGMFSVVTFHLCQPLVCYPNIENNADRLPVKCPPQCFSGKHCNLYAYKLQSGMIINFRHAGLQAFFETGSKAGICPEHAPRLNRILGILDAATQVEQINIPGLKLHKLTGNLIGFWAVSVSGNWRIIFRFENGEAMLLDYIDYH